jgi:hypothetical protein
MAVFRGARLPSRETMATDSDRQYSMKGTMDHRSTTRAVHSRAPRILAGLLLAVSMVLAAPSATAKKSEVEKQMFDCRASSSVRLKIVPRDSGILEVTAIVFSEDDDVWDWKLRHNGDLSGKGTVKAKDADRSFKVVRDMADFPGIDDVDFRAQNTATNEVCRASLSY